MSRTVSLILLSFLFFVFRLSVLCAFPESIYNFEELYNGTIARELLSNHILSLFEYQYDPYSGGSLVVGILAAPLFLLFGHSLFSLKLVAVLFSWGTLLCWFILLDRYVGRLTAFAAGLFFCFPPPNYLLHSLIAFGSHMESSFFTALLFLLSPIFSIRSGQTAENTEYWKKMEVLRIFLCGMISGFSIYFDYMSGIGVFVFLLVWALKERASLLKHLPTYLLGAVIGFLPWFIYNLEHSFSGLSIYSRKFAQLLFQGTRQEFFEKMNKYLFTDFVSWIGHERSLDDVLLLVFVGFSIFLTAVSFLIGIIHVRSVFFKASNNAAVLRRLSFLYIFFFSLTYLASSFEAYPESAGIYTYRYLAPLFPFLVLAMALVIPLLKKLYIQIPVILVFGLCGFLANLGLLHSSSPGLCFFYKGYSYRIFGLELARQSTDEFKVAVRKIEKISNPEDRYACHVGYATLVETKRGEELGHLQDGPLKIARLRENLIEIDTVAPEEARTIYQKELAFYLGFHSEDFATCGSFPKKLVLAEVFPRDARPDFLESLFMQVQGSLDMKIRCMRSAFWISDMSGMAATRGIGRGLGLLYKKRRFSPKPFETRIAGIRERVEHSLIYGFGENALPRLTWGSSDNKEVNALPVQTRRYIADGAKKEAFSTFFEDPLYREISLDKLKWLEQSTAWNRSGHNGESRTAQ